MANDKQEARLCKICGSTRVRGLLQRQYDLVKALKEACETVLSDPTDKSLSPQYWLNRITGETDFMSLIKEDVTETLKQLLIEHVTHCNPRFPNLTEYGQKCANHADELARKYLHELDPKWTQGAESADIGKLDTADKSEYANCVRCAIGIQQAHEQNIPYEVSNCPDCLGTGHVAPGSREPEKLNNAQNDEHVFAAIHPVGGATCHEIADALGLKNNAVGKALGRLKAAGRIEHLASTRDGERMVRRALAESSLSSPPPLDQMITCEKCGKKMHRSTMNHCDVCPGRSRKLSERTIRG